MDKELEGIIDEAGRAEVFARANALGWSQANPPPKWVWYQIAREVSKAKANATQTENQHKVERKNYHG